MTQTAAEPASSAQQPGTGGADFDYPIREYIASMALELAKMARGDGDEPLAVLLEAGAGRANEPAPVREAPDTIDPDRGPGPGDQLSPTVPVSTSPERR